MSLLADQIDNTKYIYYKEALNEQDRYNKTAYC